MSENAGGIFWLTRVFAKISVKNVL